jgi:hypothetical protein
MTLTMPFTLSHPAAIIPFRRYAGQSTSLCALVIGSISPDFVYFFPLGIKAAFSHSMLGIFLFCIPASLIVYVSYYLLMRQPLLAIMPDAIAARMNPQAKWIPAGISSMLVIAGSFAIGAGTHVAWDAFTHGNTFVVKNFQFLRTPVSPADGLRMPLYKVLQHLSSVLGLIVLTVSVLRWMRRTPKKFMRSHRLSPMAQALVVAGILAAGFGGGMVGSMTWPARTVERVIVNGVINGMTALALAILAFCVYWRIRTLRKVVDV